MNIDQRTRLYGVVGHQIGHTLGPTMHNAALATQVATPWHGPIAQP